MKSTSVINLHSVIECSRVNGPGKRIVVFFQGCIHGCKGCFNRDTYKNEPHSLYIPEEVFAKHLRGDIRGLTVSGGEPFLQPEGLTELLKIARTKYKLSTVVYTGYLYEELLKDKRCADAFEYIDVLIDGPFIEEELETTLLARGSSNQRFHFISNTYRIEDFSLPGRSEIIIQKDGNVLETGFSRITTQDSYLIH